jgi:DNA-binding transcriptional ArsR family regulator
LGVELPLNGKKRDLCDCRIIHRQTVEAARASELDPAETERVVRTFKALADVSRLRILWALSRHEMCVCDLAALLGLTESAVSHQLRLLRNLQLVANRRDGVVLYYRLADTQVAQLIQVALEHVGHEVQL